MRILWIDPLGTDVFTPNVFKILEAAKRDGTEVEAISLPADRPKHLEYHAYEALVVSDLVRIAFEASKEFDAIVIGCFYDVGLREVREVSGRAIVTAPCQSATAIAR